MKLFTKDIDKKLCAHYPKGSDLANQMVVAKIFNPYGRGTWYIINSDPDDPDDLWAIVDLFDVAAGSVSRSELENILVPPFRLNLERDSSFSPTNALELYNGLRQGKMYQTGGTADSAMSNDPMIGGTAESSMKRGGRIEQGDYVKVKPQYGDISGEVTFANDNIIVIKNTMGKTYMFHPHDLVHQMSKGGKLGIGDTVYISDDKSMFKGQSGTILSQLTPSTFLVKILVDGNERNVVVRKSGVEHIENLEEGGLMTSDDVYSYDTQEPMMAEGGSVKKQEMISLSDELFGDGGFSKRFVGAKSKEGHIATGEWNVDGDTVYFIYEDEKGNPYESVEMPVMYLEFAKGGKTGTLRKDDGWIIDEMSAYDNFEDFYKDALNYEKHAFDRYGENVGKLDYTKQELKNIWDMYNHYGKGQYAKGGGVGEKITKSRLKAKLYKPTGDFFIEDKGEEWYLHFTPKDASNNSSNLSDLNAKSVGNGYHGSAYSVKKVINHKYANGGGVKDSGLYVIGRTQIDNNAIKDVIEEEGFYAEWNVRGGYWFFPEEVDNYDELENQLSTIFDKQGINARFEGIFKKGGRFDSIFNKAKELSKKGYEKSKAYTKQKVKDTQRKVAVDVLNTTQNKVGTRDKDVLDKARVLVINKYQKGGTLVELEKQIPVFERQHIKGYKAYYDAKKRLEAAEKKHNNTMQSKRIIDNYTTLMIKAKKTYSDNIKKELEGKAEGYIGDKKMAKGGATPSQKKKVGKVMHEWKAGKLHSGSKKGPIVKSQEQAVAIALSEAGLSKNTKTKGWKHKRK
jgi:hypothetical protein